jgi:hypothetical protein
MEQRESRVVTGSTILARSGAAGNVDRSEDAPLDAVDPMRADVVRVRVGVDEVIRIGVGICHLPVPLSTPLNGVKILRDKEALVKSILDRLATSESFRRQ